MLTKKLNYKWKYIFVNSLRSASRVSAQIPACFCISWRVQDKVLFARFLQELIKQKKLETSPLMKLVNYQTSHLVQNICISVYLYNVLENFQGYIFTHA